MPWGQGRTLPLQQGGSTGASGPWAEQSQHALFSSMPLASLTVAWLCSSQLLSRLPCGLLKPMFSASSLLLLRMDTSCMGRKWIRSRVLCGHVRLQDKE